MVVELSAAAAKRRPVTPVLAGRRSCRTVRMKILDPDEVAQLGVTAHGDQSDFNQINRGTVHTHSWRGEKATRHDLS